MNPRLYRSAMEGDVAELGRHKDVLDKQLTPNQNTILHVAAQSFRVQYVKEVLKDCPFSLLIRQNVKGETPLHIAAREGQAEIVEALIACAERLEEELESGLVAVMLRVTNVDGDTALHMAVRNCHLEEAKSLGAVKFLLKQFDVHIVNNGSDTEEAEKIMRATMVDRDIALRIIARNRYEKENGDAYLEVVKLLSRADAEFQHPPNNFRETPLYLAAERGITGVAIVKMLVDTYGSLLTYGSPGGRTALHAAALKDPTGQSTKKLLQWKKDLINQADANGWTPLHYAACNNSGKVVEELLETDLSVAYITTSNKDDLNTALHIAAAHGHLFAFKKLLSYNPDCWEMVNSKGQNVLHIAVDMNRKSVIEFMLYQKWVRQLINQKDNEGNTPIHLLISSECNVGKLWNHHRADRHAFNGKNMTPIDLVWSNFKEERMSTFAATSILSDSFLDSEIDGERNIACNAHNNARARTKRIRQMETETEKQTEERATMLFQTLVVVASLIATITFASAFAIPGGYDQGSDAGMAVLARQAAFKGFVITNTLAMVSSVVSIFLALITPLYTLVKHTDQVHIRAEIYKRYKTVGILVLYAMLFLMLAFITASFAVLAHSRGLLVSTCVIACFSFAGYGNEFRSFFETHVKYFLKTKRFELWDF